METSPQLKEHSQPAAQQEGVKPFEKEEGAKKEGQLQGGCFVFPDGGWECNKCQNYNFKGRKACFRCKKAKSTDDNDGKPEHMTKPLKKGGKKVRKDETTVTNENSSVEFNKVKKDKKAGNTERVGDWTCQRCFNHNFSFREACNMCYMSQVESMRLLYQQQ